jgi:hypothetical protein
MRLVALVDGLLARCPDIVVALLSTGLVPIAPLRHAVKAHTAY